MCVDGRQIIIEIGPDSDGSVPRGFDVDIEGDVESSELTETVSVTDGYVFSHYILVTTT